jgi:hypothetical protein
MKKVSRRVMFLRDKKGMPVGCVAISLSQKTNKIRYQVSVLNPIDSFKRDLARQIALGRLLEKPFVIPMRGTGQYDITFEVMNAIESNTELPKRARKAATLWLDSQ